jgi:hypothetical protein
MRLAFGHAAGLAGRAPSEAASAPVREVAVMAMKTRIVKAQRSRTLPEAGGETLFFKLDIGRLGKFVRPANMPPFEGEEGYVEVEGPNTRLTVLRQVPKPIWAPG